MLTDKQLEELFKTFDNKGTGYLNKHELRDFCATYDLGTAAADAIFEELDSDRDGKINFDDFRSGFNEFLAPHQENKEISKTSDVWSNDLSCIPGVRDEHIKLYRELQSFESPQLISSFENLVESLVENVRRLQDENIQLENSWKREKKEQEVHLHLLEEEMDTQVKDIEIRMKQQAREEFEVERKSLKTKMTLEMDKLQDHLFLFEKVASWLKANHSTPNQDIINKLQEALDENKQLRLSLIDTQTSVAFMKNDLQHLRKLYEEKCRELDCERQRVLDILHEQDNLSRQLHLLHEANRTLQDINDSLREHDGRHAGLPTIYRIASGSILGDYLKDDIPILPSCRSTDDDGISDIEYWEVTRDSDRLTAENDETEKNGDDVDSGMSTLRSTSAISEESEARFLDVTHNDQNKCPNKTLKSNSGCQTIIQCDPRSQEELENPKPLVVSNQTQNSSFSPGIRELKRRLGVDTKKASYSRLFSHSYLPSISEKNSQENTTSNKNKTQVKRQYSDERYKATGPAEKSFKVVFVGDSYVGKTSFILQLSRGTFFSDVNNTLGLDIQTKVLKVDGSNVGIQLWDTAGQERFRSITQSYFRNVDGVILLYDCTSESSFLSVRQWVEAIQDSVSTSIPLQLVGNKVDLREMSSASQTTVTNEDGLRLARTFGAAFTEASAKTGFNVVESVVDLIRNMMKHQEWLSEETNSVINLKDASPSKKSSCCLK